MPLYRIPKKSGPHRIAAIALYRALLTQCKAAPIAESEQHELRNLIRNRFRQSKDVQSARRLKVSFEAGYVAIDHMDNAVAGAEGSKEYITSLLERVPAKAKKAPERKLAVDKKIETVKDTATSDQQPQRPKVSIFDRPLPLEKLSGKRHIPVLFSANRIPVLRIKKPQPESLSRYIDQRIRQRQKLHNRYDQFEHEVKIASYEDEWDKLIFPFLPAEQDIRYGMRGTWAYEPTWKSAVGEALRAVSEKLSSLAEENRTMAEKMQAVVDRETELYYKEREERRVAKRQHRLERKQGCVEDVHVPDQDVSRDAIAGFK